MKTSRPAIDKRHSASRHAGPENPPRTSDKDVNALLEELADELPDDDQADDKAHGRRAKKK